MRDMAAFGGMAMMNEPMPGQVVDHAKLHADERDSLELIGAVGPKDIRWVGDGIEQRVLRMYA